MNEYLNTTMMHPREQIALVIARIYRRALTTTSRGNVSMIDDNGDVWITPSAVDKGSLQPADIVCVKRDGTIIGKHKPSSELPFHKAIYAMRPGIKAVIHGSQAQLEMPRDRLKKKESARIKASCDGGFRNELVIGTSAIAKITATRAPQPP